MQEIYVVKVKTKPEASKLYPSERRYSASTVGGLGLVHLLLGGTTLLLAALGLVAEHEAAGRYGAAIAMGVAAVASAVTATLAWRRWYIDNNIRHFLITSTVSCVAALLCLVLTSIALATVQEELSQRHLDRHLTKLPLSLPLTSPEENTTDIIDVLVALNETIYSEINEEINQEGITVDNNNYIQDNSSKLLENSEVKSETTEELTEIRNVLLINILVSSLVELLWSVLSIRIAWKGMNNNYSDTDGNNGRIVEGAEKKIVKETVRGKPDIISNHQHQRVIEDKKKAFNNMMNVNVISEGDEYLPKDESSVEYEERVRKFLASNNES